MELPFGGDSTGLPIPEHKPCLEQCEYGSCGRSGYQGCGGCCSCLGGCQIAYEISLEAKPQFDVDWSQVDEDLPF